MSFDHNPNIAALIALEWLELYIDPKKDELSPKQFANEFERIYDQIVSSPSITKNKALMNDIHKRDIGK